MAFVKGGREEGHRAHETQKRRGMLGQRVHQEKWNQREGWLETNPKVI